MSRTCQAKCEGSELWRGSGTYARGKNGKDLGVVGLMVW